MVRMIEDLIVWLLVILWTGCLWCIANDIREIRRDIEKKC